MTAPPEQPKEISNLLKQATVLHQKGNLAEAEHLYLQILEVEPDHFDALSLLGTIRDQQGRTNEAVQFLSAALKVNPKSTHALLNFAIVQKKLGRPEQALETYEKLLATCPNNAAVLNDCGILQAELKRYELALASYDKALALKPNFAEALNNRGATLRKLKRFKEALVSYDKALTIKSDYINAHYNRAAMLLDLGRFDDALVSYGNSLASNPHFIEALNGRGTALVNLKRYEEALACYDKTLAINPDHAEAHHGRGTALESLGRVDEAIVSYDKALAIRKISILDPLISNPDRQLDQVNNKQASGLEFVVEWRPLAALEAIVGDWRMLVSRTLESNVFLEPAFALAAASVFGSEVGAALVWTKTLPRQLVGLFPGRIERVGSARCLVGWRNPETALGTPLIDYDKGEEVIEEYLDYVYNASQLPNLIILPFIREAGSFMSTLNRVLIRRGDRVAMFDRHQRGQLAPERDRASYLDLAIGSKKRKGNLRRAREHLEQSGRVEFLTATANPGIATALSDFFTLEASGWKGRSGSAATSRLNVRKFFEAAILGLAADGKARIDRLMISDRAIAASVTFYSGNDAWFWKTAYDEEFANVSPGVLLIVDLTKALLADLTIARVDGCAQRDNPLINHIWRERLPITHLVVAAGPEANVGFDLRYRDLALRLSERR